jgi:hypothetical protein
MDIALASLFALDESPGGVADCAPSVLAVGQQFGGVGRQQVLEGVLLLALATGGGKDASPELAVGKDRLVREDGVKLLVERAAMAGQFRGLASARGALPEECPVEPVVGDQAVQGGRQKGKGGKRQNGQNA